MVPWVFGSARRDSKHGRVFLPLAARSIFQICGIQFSRRTILGCLSHGNTSTACHERDRNDARPRTLFDHPSRPSENQIRQIKINLATLQNLYLADATRTCVPAPQSLLAGFAILCAIVPDTAGWVCFGFAITQYLIIGLVTSKDKALDALSEFDRQVALRRRELLDEFDYIEEEVQRKNAQAAEANTAEGE